MDRPCMGSASPSNSLSTPAMILSSEDLPEPFRPRDRKSTRLNSSHLVISYAVFCLKKKTFVIAYYVHPVNIQPASIIVDSAEFTVNITHGVERPVIAAELFAFTLRVRAGNTDVLTDAEENVRQKLRAEGVM